MIVEGSCGTLHTWPHVTWPR